MPGPACFQMPLSRGSAKASGNRAKRSWILNKLGFLSHIVGRPLSKSLRSHQIGKSQLGRGLQEQWCAVSFRKLIFFKIEEQHIKKKLRRLTDPEMIFDSWQWRRQQGVDPVAWPEACQFMSLDSVSGTLRVRHCAEMLPHTQCYWCSEHHHKVASWHRFTPRNPRFKIDMPEAAHWAGAELVPCREPGGCHLPHQISGLPVR